MPDEFADPFFIEVIVSRRAIHQRGLRNRFSSGPILFSFFLMLSGFANAQQSSEQKSAAIEPVVERVVDYTDSIGVEWRRWTIVDDIDGKKLLMVLEAPVDSLDDHSTSQVVLEQKSFSLNNLQELDERMRYFYELKDLSSRDSQFDKDRKELGVMNFKPLWIPRKNS